MKVIKFIVLIYSMTLLIGCNQNGKSEYEATTQNSTNSQNDNKSSNQEDVIDLDQYFDDSVQRLNEAKSLTIDEQLHLRVKVPNFFAFTNTKDYHYYYKSYTDIVREPFYVKSFYNYNNSNKATHYITEEQGKTYIIEETDRNDYNYKKIEFDYDTMEEQSVTPLDYVFEQGPLGGHNDPDYIPLAFTNNSESAHKFDVVDGEIIYNESFTLNGVTDYYKGMFDDLILLLFGEDASQPISFYNELITLEIKFDQKTKTLTEVSYNLNNIAEAYLLGNYDISQSDLLSLDCTYTISFGSLNEIEPDHLEALNYYYDDSPDKRGLENRTYKTLGLNDQMQGLFEVTGDVDVYTIKVDEKADYLFSINSDESIFVNLVNENGEVRQFDDHAHLDEMKNQSIFSVELSEGEYTLILNHKGKTDSIKYDISITEVTEEDLYADTIIFTEDSNPIGEINQTEQVLNGSIEYKGDDDLFIVNNQDLINQNAYFRAKFENATGLYAYLVFDDQSEGSMTIYAYDPDEEGNIDIRFRLQESINHYLAIGSDHAVRDYSVDVNLYRRSGQDDQLVDSIDDPAIKTVTPLDVITSNNSGYFKLRITESGTYQLLNQLDGEKRPCNFIIMNEDGEELHSLNLTDYDQPIALESGEYYVLLDHQQYSDIADLTIQKVDGE